MKALPSIAFSGFRGTASEVTARQTGGRTVLSGRAQHSHVKTPKQSVRRASFAYISRLYRTLSQEQLSAWASLAAAHREQALIGDGAPLTGHNLFEHQPLRPQSACHKGCSYRHPRLAICGI